MMMLMNDVYFIKFSGHICKIHGSAIKSNGQAAKFCSALEQSTSPKLQNMQQSPDLGFKIALQTLH
jgi:hypothetical protein